MNEQIKDPVTATHDGTVAAIASLALVEVSAKLPTTVAGANA